MNEIKLTIDGQKYTINPRLTLGEYMSLQKIQKGDLSTPKLLETITGVPEKEIKKIDSNRTYILLIRL